MNPREAADKASKRRQRKAASLPTYPHSIRRVNNFWPRYIGAIMRQQIEVENV